MGKRLRKNPDETIPVVCFRYGSTDVGRWRNLVTGEKKNGTLDVDPDDLRVVAMDYYGISHSGYLSTWGQTGCTVIMALRDVGGCGEWGYFSHVRSSQIEHGLEHLAKTIEHLPARDSMTIILMGGYGGEGTYLDFLRRFPMLGGDWRWMLILKPESDLQESVLRVDDCTFAFAKSLVDSTGQRQYPGFQPSRVPFEIKYTEAPLVTGHPWLDEAIKTSKTKKAIWVDLCVLMMDPEIPTTSSVSGLPALMDRTAPDWICHLDNLRNVLTHLRQLKQFAKLDVDDATAKLLRHLQQLPRE